MTRRGPARSVPAALKAPAIAAIVVAGWFACHDALRNVGPSPGIEALKQSESASLRIDSATIDRWASANPRRYFDPAVKRWARAVVREDPLNASAIRIYGFAQGTTGNEAATESAVRLAARLSRRESLTQLWLIEREAARGNVSATLRHYDVLLRTRLRLRPVLFETLSQALSEPEIRKGFAGYVRQSPDWLEPFVIYAIDYARLRAPVALAFEDAGGLPKARRFQMLETRFLQALIAGGEVGAGRRFYRSMTGAQPAELRETGFNPSTTEQRFAPLSWQVMESPTISTIFEIIGTGAQLAARIEVSPTSHGVALRRHFELAKGRHHIRVVLGESSGSTRPRMQWMVRCSPSASPFASWRGASGAFTIPANCPDQIIELTVAAADSQTATELVLTDVRISAGGNLPHR